MCAFRIKVCTLRLGRNGEWTIRAACQGLRRNIAILCRQDECINVAAYGVIFFLVGKPVEIEIPIGSKKQLPTERILIKVDIKIDVT